MTHEDISKSVIGYINHYADLYSHIKSGTDKLRDESVRFVSELCRKTKYDKNYLLNFLFSYTEEWKSLVNSLPSKGKE